MLYVLLNGFQGGRICHSFFSPSLVWRSPRLRLVGAIDQGTTSTRVILYNIDDHFRPLATHQVEHAQILPRPGWVEHDPMEILACTNTCIREALKVGLRHIHTYG